MTIAMAATVFSSITQLGYERKQNKTKQNDEYHFQTAVEDPDMTPQIVMLRNVKLNEYRKREKSDDKRQLKRKLPK